MTINPMAFVENLRYMGLGMLGIFVVIGVIIAITFILNRLLPADKNGNGSDDDQ